MPWTALGFAERATAPRRFAVCFAELRDMAHFLGGSVLSPDTFDESFEPVELGLFDEWTFGRLRRDAQGRVLLRSFFEEHPSERPQGWLFGSLQLCEPVVHPWALCFAPHILARPSTPHIVCLPVLPAGYRPSVLKDGELATHPLTMHLTRLLNFGRRLARVKEIEAPELIVEGQRERVQMAMSARNETSSSGLGGEVYCAMRIAAGNAGYQRVRRSQSTCLRNFSGLNRSQTSASRKLGRALTAFA